MLGKMSCPYKKSVVRKVQCKQAAPANARRSARTNYARLAFWVEFLVSITPYCAVILLYRWLAGSCVSCACTFQRSSGAEKQGASWRMRKELPQKTALKYVSLRV